MLVGCAGVEVTKITDRNRDTEKGFRYYLPRPYIAVKKPMPVQGEDFFVYGVIQEGHVIKVDVSKLPRRQKEAFVGLGSPNLVALPQALVATGMSAEFIRQSASANQNAADPAPPAATAGDQPKEQSYSTASGTFGGNVKTELHQVINDYYDILYLQDFSEQYAIRYHAGLGYASGHVNLANGWVMDGADIKIDNTVLGKFIFNNVDKLVDLAVSAGKTAISPAAALTNGTKTSTASNPVQQAASARSGAASLEALNLPNGKNVLLRVQLVTEAQPGPYPLLKPGENPTGTADGPAFYPDKDGRMLPVRGTQQRFVLLPFRPYTAVAYNVRKTASIVLVSGAETPLATAAPETTRTASNEPGKIPEVVDADGDPLNADQKKQFLAAYAAKVGVSPEEFESIWFEPNSKNLFFKLVAASVGKTTEVLGKLRGMAAAGTLKVGNAAVEKVFPAR